MESLVKLAVTVLLRQVHHVVQICKCVKVLQEAIVDVTEFWKLPKNHTKLIILLNYVFL